MTKFDRKFILFLVVSGLIIVLLYSLYFVNENISIVLGFVFVLNLVFFLMILQLDYQKMYNKIINEKAITIIKDNNELSIIYDYYLGNGSIPTKLLEKYDLDKVVNNRKRFYKKLLYIVSIDTKVELPKSVFMDADYFCFRWKFTLILLGLGLMFWTFGIILAANNTWVGLSFFSMIAGLFLFIPIIVRSRLLRLIFGHL